MARREDASDRLARGYCLVWAGQVIQKICDELGIRGCYGDFDQEGKRSRGEFLPACWVDEMMIHIG